MPAPRLSKAVASVSAAAVLLSTLFALPVAAAQDPAIDARPVAPPSTANSPQPPEASSRFVVKFKTGALGAATARAKAYGQVAHASGIPVRELRTTATGATVVQATETLTPSESASVVASLRGQASAEYAEPDTFVRPSATVSDPLHQYQWDLSEEKAGMRVPAAWEITAGLGTVVAVIDTGITPHSDLSANIVPGYDFISDPSLSNDGDGRDANATDAGDYCNGAASSWHGTHVAGTIAAVANNGRGVAGVAYGAKVQPLRALGSCGGYLSDIADAVVWAAGGIVNGVPANATPAKAINMSLGGSGECSVYFQSALDFAAAQGVAVVAAAGNENSPTSGSTPANCDKIITVGATGRTGSRAFYSNYGPEVDVSAPGGDASTSGYDAILSTWNDGQTTAGNEAYGFMQGTSMAAPHVAAVAALMMTAGSTLTPTDVEAKLKSNARLLPGSCDTGGCGAGLVDAGAAVRASLAAPPTLSPGTPSIAGSTWVGETLSAQQGTWSPSGVLYFYQWLRNGEPIPSADGPTYRLVAGDVGTQTSVRVFGYKSGWGGASATSEPVGPITAGKPIVDTPIPVPGVTIAPAPSETPTPDPTPTETTTPSPTPTETSTPEPSPTETIAPPAYVPRIVGEAKVGSTLTAEEGRYGVWRYQWSNNDGPINRATGRAYVPKPSDVGKTIAVTVTVYSLSLDEEDATGTSAVTEPVAEGTLSAAKPTTTGSAAVGQTISAVTGTWSAGATLSYQWYRGGASIPTATARSYTPVADDLGQPLTVSVTGTASGYSPLTVESEPTAPVAPGTLTGPDPTITGVSAVGRILTADAGTWTPNTTLSYQWFRSGVTILAATAASYTLGANDLGRAMTVRVTGAKAGYTSAARESVQTAAVAAGTLTAPVPAISGTRKVGYTLTATPGTWTAGTTLRYQWYRSGVAIAGATGSRYTLGAADLGKGMKVSVTGSKAGYASASRYSVQTTAVVAGTLSGPNPRISGTLRSGYVLTANAGTWTAGTTLRYQWYRSGVAIKGATGRQYRLVAADRYDTMRVRVIGSKPGYTSLARYSGITSRIP